MKLRIGSRGSFLALIQSKEAIQAIKEKFPAIDIELVIIKTAGDKSKDPLAKAQIIGVFVKELEEELLTGNIDLAVHSLKDVPTSLPKGLRIGAALKRETPYDVLVSTRYSWDSLPDRAVIGTGSTRRRAQLLQECPGLLFKDLRGNMHTRIGKLEKENLDAIVCAQAALIRLQIINPSGICTDEKYARCIFTPLAAEIMLPAAGQGIIGIEYKQDNEQIDGILKSINHMKTFHEARAERSFLASIGGGCLVPAGAFAQIKGNTISLDGFHANEDGGNFRREKLIYPLERMNEIGRDLAEKIKATK